jgi:hypothetical protein
MTDLISTKRSRVRHRATWADVRFVADANSANDMNPVSLEVALL